MDQLTLFSDHLETMLAHLRASLPHEGCGLLAGRAGRVTHVLTANNVSSRPLVEYEMDPYQQLRHFEWLDDQGLDLVGIFHSHPVGPAYPSPTDLARAFYPDSVYVIISLLEVDAPQVRGFLIDDHTVHEVEIVVE
jgi:proteasome lid subunit RPN8/RPN11